MLDTLKNDQNHYFIIKIDADFLKFSLKCFPAFRLSTHCTRSLYFGHVPGGVIILQPLHCTVSINFIMISYSKEVVYCQFNDMFILHFQIQKNVRNKK